ncbi:hypothetical protein BWQ96_08063 [Gracilariopsis chorda]|uniref:Uncharacterized protein n=1 Tax=Gracilariopsis chorda TaxID=448386 RepID=A0A2V3IJG0_9FLOR|nr:hypothetical protein BWQ96_08063 [Gracilariopsis chorda]|eukprot:PXF42235.1 hypothetical protein BWQ96_08063 [Gracilariopsis chorda]
MSSASRDTDMALARKSMDNGDEGADVRVITIQISKRTLRSFLGIDRTDGDVVLTRPRITLAAVSQVKDMLSSQPKGDKEPLRFVVETEKPEDCVALEIRRHQLKYGFSVDGYYEKGILIISDIQKIEDKEAEAVDVEDNEEPVLPSLDSFSSPADLESSTGELEYGFDIAENNNVGLTKWATARDLDTDSYPALHLDDVTIEGLEV